MKKISKILFSLLLSAAAVSSMLCSCAVKPMSTDEVKKAVYEQLSEPDKNSVSDTWEDAEVEEIIFDSSSMSGYHDENGKSVSREYDEYDGQSVYHIIIEVPDARFTGDIDIIADMKTGKILGLLGRD